LHTFPAGAAAVFSHDSARIALTYNGKEPFVSVRDVRTGREISHFRQDKANWPLLLSFATDGEKLFALGAKVAAYDTTTGKLLFSWRKPAPAPDADTRPGRFKEAEIVDGILLEKRVEQFWWRAGAFSPSGTLAAFNTRAEQVGNYPGRDRLVLCDATTGRVYRRWRDSDQVTQETEHMLFSPDGRLLASTDRSVVYVWEVATAKKVRTFQGHRGRIEALAFSADGRRLASSGTDSTTLVWDLTPGPNAGASDDTAVAAWWADLAGDDAARASVAAWHLAAAPGPAVTLLRQHLRPVTADDLKAARARIAELDGESFDVREKAAAEIERLGTAAVPALERALRDRPAPEAKRRIEQLLEKLDPLPGSGEPLRAWRALAVLERAGTPEAKRLLQELAAGEPGVWLTREARDALRRLAK
jgi:hypothetical protein